MYNKTMKIVGLDKLTLVDYPEKTACIIFTGGCNFRCPFCHNASIVMGDEPEIAQEEIFAFLKKRKAVLNAVVVSGGEPTIYPDLPEFIKKIKELGYAVKLDTNGTNPAMLEFLIKEHLIDYVAMDIKNSFTNYAFTTGVPNINTKNIQTSINWLKRNLNPYEFRTTLVGGHHEEEDIYEMGEMLKGAQVVYLQHFKDVGGCLQQGLQEVPKKQAELYKKILQTFIKNVYLRGY